MGGGGVAADKTTVAVVKSAHLAPTQQKVAPKREETHSRDFTEPMEAPIDTARPTGGGHCRWNRFAVPCSSS